MAQCKAIRADKKCGGFYCCIRAAGHSGAHKTITGNWWPRPKRKVKNG